MPGFGRGPPGRGGMPDAPPGRGMPGGPDGRGAAPGTAGLMDAGRGAPVPKGLFATRGPPGRGPGAVADSATVGAGVTTAGAAVAAIGSTSGVRTAGPGVGALEIGAAADAVAGGMTDAGDAAGARAGATVSAAIGASTFLAGGFFTVATAAGMASRSLRTTGASTVEDGPLTYSPSSPSLARTSLLVTPSSFASSCTRGLPGTALLLQGEPGSRPRWL